MKFSWPHLGCVFGLLQVFAISTSYASPLPNTEALLDDQEDLSERVMQGAHRFVERKILDQIQKRDSYPETPQILREKLSKMLGLQDATHLKGDFESFGTGFQSGLVASHEKFEVRQIRWQVTPHYQAEALLLQPKHPTSEDIWLVLPDADETPEQVLGIGTSVPDHHKHVRQLAESGVTLLVPAWVNTQEHQAGLPLAVSKPVGQSRREWLHRQAFHMGKHLLGYEVQSIQTAMDHFLSQMPTARFHLIAHGEGALIGLLTSGLDDRIQSSRLSGLLGQEVQSWEQPLFRNLFGFERDLGWKGLLRLHGKRPLSLDLTPIPVYKDSKGELRGRVDETALQHLVDSVKAETHITLVARAKVHHATAEVLPDLRKDFDSEARQKRLLTGLERDVQERIRVADFVRDESFMYQAEPALRRSGWSTRPRHAILNPHHFLQTYEDFRRKFEEEAMGKFDEPLSALHPKTRLIMDHPRYVAYDVVLPVYSELEAWGALLLPKDLKPNEKRPVVVLQHGRNGIPRNLIDGNKTGYANAAVTLVERGFIVLVPHNLYRGEDLYRTLDRKANALGATLFSFILPSHQQFLNFLKSLPQVDGNRIAFYGLSYGGESAMRLPPVLKDYSVVICSGDFNQWTRKVAATDYPGSFMYSIEWEMPYWNLGNTFDYAEMAYLIFPRPFMVERGHHDLVAPDSWVAHEFAKVQYLYAQFGMADRVKMFSFQGGHAMANEESFDFLHEHLQWPKKREARSER